MWILQLGFQILYAILEQIGYIIVQFTSEYSCRAVGVKLFKSRITLNFDGFLWKFAFHEINPVKNQIRSYVCNFISTDSC